MGENEKRWPERSGHAINWNHAEGVGVRFSVFASTQPYVLANSAFERALGALYFAQVEMERVAEGKGWEKLEALLHAARKRDRELRAKAVRESEGE